MIMDGGDAVLIFWFSSDSSLSPPSIHILFEPQEANVHILLDGWRLAIKISNMSAMAWRGRGNRERISDHQLYIREAFIRNGSTETARQVFIETMVRNHENWTKQRVKTTEMP